MVQTKLPNGSYIFLGLVVQLETADSVEAGSQDYCALRVAVQDGKVTPRLLLARSRDLHLCIRTLRSPHRTLDGGVITFDPPSSELGHWDGGGLTRLQSLAPSDLAAAKAHLELA